MQSIVRYDYYPHFKRPARQSTQPRSAASSGLQLIGAAPAEIAPDWRTIPDTDANERASIDVFRLLVALLGLTVYLGPPVAGIAYLAFKVFA